MNEGNTETLRKLMSLKELDPIEEDLDEAITKVETMAARGGRYLLSADVMTLIVQQVLSMRPEEEQPESEAAKIVAPPVKRGPGRPRKVVEPVLNPAEI